MLFTGGEGCMRTEMMCVCVLTIPGEGEVERNKVLMVTHNSYKLQLES